MKQEHILILFWTIILGVVMSVVHATDAHQLSPKSYNSASAFDDDPFFQSDDVFKQIRNMQLSMDRLMRQQFKKINSNSIGFTNLKNMLNPSQDIQMRELNNELSYTIQKPEGVDSKIDVSVKDGILIVNTHLMQKRTYRENGSKSYSYSQSSYMQSFKLPNAYDPDTMDLKTKDATLIVSFKKRGVPSSLKI
ncbi:Hsp20 family protein [Legionella waltersii]|uniref:Heat shock hsp20 n=1 Tax=Legionella waltersii TaxID=66969 RepID=A0A0W1AAW8_9GAMM|nr:Hsp20 family protein [Legionella waltersii]KTD78481.1 heat shock hsp20 [Legionella waltersii]SNV05837.1 Heat shock hsp20 [Legionella waltersii]